MISSPPSDHNGHLRNLLDQRNACADVHGRLSAAMSDFSDTTSVYSHSYLSPRPSELGESRVGHTYASSISNVSTERYEPHTSILDLTDDPRTLYTSQDYENGNSTPSDEVPDEREAMARMSYLGPKMRVHSRAPWEEETLEEVDEDNFTGSFSFSRKHAAKNIDSAISSPRPSFAGSGSRQSEDSSISLLVTKRSVETINSQVSLSHPRGRLYALAQESMSSNELARRTPAKEHFLNKLSIGRLRGEASITSNIPPVSSPMSSLANNLIPTDVDSQSFLSKSHSVTSASSSHDSLEFLSVRKASTHPYANPDLVVSYPEAVQDTLDPQYILPHCDSELTVTESPSTEPMATYNTQAGISMPNFSVNSVPKIRGSPISIKNISSPVTIISSPQSAQAGGTEHGLPGWTERSSTAPFTLISLEEARAKRTRTSTDTGAPVLSDSGTLFPVNSTHYSTFSPPSPVVALGSRARGRSISVGANAKNALHNVLGQAKSESRGSEMYNEGLIAGPPSGKTLRHKKSGFMRIFNRDKDPQNVPPVPSIPEGISQSSRHRVPLPSLSQPEVYGRSLQADIPTTKKSAKRVSPSLSINTTTQSSPARATLSSRPNATLSVPSPGPQSAPADRPEFPVLKLRPVSMLFSASFGDLVPSDTKVAVQDTPQSYTPPSSKSPITIPISPTRPAYDVTSVVSDENNPVVKAVQEQKLPAKNAWQKHIWELEGQVRELKAELELLRSNDEYCDKCGRGQKSPQDLNGIINRPRAPGKSSQFVNPLPSSLR